MRAFHPGNIVWGYAFGSGTRAPANWEPISLIVSIMLTILDTALGTGLLGLLYAVAVFVPGLAVGARRLHDTGRSAWWLLIALIPLIGAIVLIVFLATDGERQSNAYGPDPKAIVGEIPAFS
ncbi:MAG TPA: DUF805 domain-containing protein [Pseudonocardiaceae bacterium]|nr:DUF805 domain-containing protein [Pseudonocardiaceae bacterium]